MLVARLTNRRAPTWSPDGTELIVKHAVTGRLARVQPKAGGTCLGTYAGTEQGILPAAGAGGPL